MYRFKMCNLAFVCLFVFCLFFFPLVTHMLLDPGVFAYIDQLI